MKALHYLFGLPPVRGGGLIKYALDLAEEQRKQGLDVCLMIPSEMRKNKPTIILKKKYSGFGCYHIINPIIVTCGKKINDMTLLCKTGDIKIYIEFLRKVSPDIIHIHSLMGLHSSFLQAAKQLNIPIVYTTHDYYGLCPKCSKMASNGAECKEDGSMCELCMGSSTSMASLQRQHMQYYVWLKKNFFVNWLEYSKGLLGLKLWLRNNKKKHTELANIKNIKDNSDSFQKLNQYYREMFAYITFFHFNSTQAEDVYRKALKNINGKVINISNHSVADNRKLRSYGRILKLAYLSNRQTIKGYEVLLDTLDRLYDKGYHDFECHIYCNEDRLGTPYLRTHKPYIEKNMHKVFGNMDLLIVPSLWKETFGMVVLEAISYGVPVIISNNVGAKDILRLNKGIGIIADLENDENALYDAIKKVYEDRQVLVQMNENIIKAQLDLDYGNHVRELLELYKDLTIV